MIPAVEIEALAGIGEVGPGDRVGELISERVELADGEILCIAQKIVSKSLGLTRKLSEVEPGPAALELAAETGRDAAMLELVLSQSRRVVRATPGVVITETRSGLICANAGIDSSNVPDEDTVLLLPPDPDGSAREIRAELRRVTGARVAVIITDSFGRPWRVGQTEVAIGCAGLAPVDDLRGGTDRDGRELVATVTATADELAAAANLARGKNSGEPVVRIRGRSDLVSDADGPGAAAIQRDPSEDLFR